MNKKRREVRVNGQSKKIAGLPSAIQRRREDLHTRVEMYSARLYYIL